MKRKREKEFECKATWGVILFLLIIISTTIYVGVWWLNFALSADGPFVVIGEVYTPTL